jgi:acetolactate decarboxylase
VAQRAYAAAVEIIDHRLVGALHLLVLDHEAASRDRDADSAFQTSSIEALLDGQYEGDLTIGELLTHGDLGLGTVDHLDGELVVLDGEALVVGGDGTVRPAGPDETTPFAVVCPFHPGPPQPLGRQPTFEALTAAIDELVPDRSRVAAIRVDGRVGRARVRSVERQEPPYLPLREVVAHQHEWTLDEVDGSLVGFRFPDETGGLEIAGWHLHLISADRTCGGHVIDVDLTEGDVRIEHLSDFHVELPPSVDLPALARPDRRSAEIRAVEGRPSA